MKSRAQFHRHPLALAVAVPFLLSGCFGGSSSSSDDSSDIQLSEEEQVVGAASMGFSLVGEAPSEAADQADQAPPTGGDSTSLGTASYGMPAPEGQFDDPEIQDCQDMGELAGGDGEGAFRVAESGDYFDIEDVDYPEPFSGSVPDTGGTSNDSVVRADCVVRDGDGNVTFEYEGAFDVAEEEFDEEHRAVSTRIGAYTGEDFEDRPDVSDHAVTGMDGEETRIRSRILVCEGCDGANLETLGNDDWDPDRTATFAFFTETLSPGVELRAGNSEEDLFVNTFNETGDGGQEVTFDGAVRYLKPDTGCGFDVEYSMPEGEPLVLEDGDDGAVPVDGSIDIQPSDSDRVYTVSFNTNGTPNIQDDQGNTLDPEPSEEAMECGFIFGDAGQG